MMQLFIIIKVVDLDLVLGSALDNLGKFDEAIMMYDRAI